MKQLSTFFQSFAIKAAALSVALVYLSNPIFAQQPTLDWVMGTGGILNDQCFGTVVDDSGNVYVTGFFNGTTDFDPSPAIHNLISTGYMDIFVMKMDASGNFVWAVSMGGASYDAGNRITLDHNNNVLVTGQFRNTVDFDPGVGVINLTATGDYDIFVLKLDANGNFIWAKKMGGSGDDSGAAIAADAAGNVYTTGYFTGTGDFDPSGAVANLLSNNNTRDVFISKLDSNGNYIWATSLSDDGNDSGTGIMVNSSGNVIVSGYKPGAFVASLTNAGVTNWTRHLLFYDQSFSRDIKIDGANNIYLSGLYTGTTGYGSTSLGSQDIFVIKLNSSGYLTWFKSIGGVGDDFANALTLDPSGNIYVTGGFRNVVDFDPNSGVSNMASAGERDIFTLKLSNSGQFTWVKQFGGIQDDIGYSISIGVSNSVFVSGFFSDTTAFDGNTSLVSMGATDLFIAKLGPPCSGTTASISPTACGTYTSPSGNHVWTANGAYMDTISNSNGCDSVITINLTINSSPVPLISQVNDTLTTGNFNSYTWLLNGNPIPNTNSQNLGFTQNGDYSVVVTDANGCSDTSAVYNVTSVSIAENDLVGFRVYPNPNSGVFTVELDRGSEITELHLYDVQGRLVYRATPKKLGLIELDVEDGIYLLKVTTNKGILHQTIVIGK